jgi:hypothetical protein
MKIIIREIAMRLLSKRHWPSIADPGNGYP